MDDLGKLARAILIHILISGTSEEAIEDIATHIQHRIKGGIEEARALVHIMAGEAIVATRKNIGVDLSNVDYARRPDEYRSRFDPYQRIDFKHYIEFLAKGVLDDQTQ